MKKIATMLLTITLLCTTVLSISSCGKVPNDYKKARSNLRDSEYDVTITNDTDFSLSAFFYFLQINSDDDVAEEIEEAYDEIEKKIDEYDKRFETLLEAYDEDDENFLFILYFEDSKSARNFYKTSKYIFEVVCENGLDDSFIDAKTSDYKHGYSGNAVYIGTKSALKAA